MSIKTMFVSFIAMFALAFGMANVGSAQATAAKTTATTPYAQSLAIAQTVATHTTAQQTAAVK